MTNAYHNRVKRRIRSGELAGYEWRDNQPGVGECLMLVFKTEPIYRPIRMERIGEYVDLLAHWNKYNAERSSNHDRQNNLAGRGAGDPQQPHVV